MSITDGGRLHLPLAVPTDKGETHVEVSVFYQKGQTNIATGNQELGGIYVAAIPIIVKDGMVSRILFRGQKDRIVPMARLNRKALGEAFEQVKREVEESTGPAQKLIDAQAFKIMSLVTPAVS
jgi:hypothetical protein